MNSEPFTSQREVHMTFICYILCTYVGCGCLSLILLPQLIKGIGLFIFVITKVRANFDTAMNLAFL